MNPWEVFERGQPVKLYGKNQMIYWQEETAIQFYYLKNGLVKTFLSSPHGAEKTLTVVEPGHIFGEASFFDGLPRMSSAKTLEKSEIISVGQENLMACIQQTPALAMRLMQHLSHTIRLLSAQVDGMAFLQADKRVARLLLDISGGQGTAMTHEELAALAGVSRVTVSRALGAFARRGWVSTGYGRVQIADAAALRRYTESST